MAVELDLNRSVTELLPGDSDLEMVYLDLEERERVEIYQQVWICFYLISIAKLLYI